MGFRIEYYTGAMEMEQFRQKYQDREKYMAYCRECPRYDALWSCPPLSFDVDAFLQPYTWVSPVCAKIILDDETIRAADDAEKIKETGWAILSRVKRDIDAGCGPWSRSSPEASPCPPADAIFAKAAPENPAPPAVSRTGCAIRWTLSAST